MVSNTIFNINIGGFKEFHPTRHIQLKKGYKSEGISINSYGILGAEFDLLKKNNTVRILTIGNSVTFSPPSENYSIVLEKELNKSFPNNDVEVIVGAVPGYSSYQALDWYNEFLYKLKPNIAIIYLGWNDMGQYHPFGLKYKNENLYQKQSILGYMMQNIFMLRLPYFFIGRLERSKPVDLSPLNEEEEKVLNEFYPLHFEENLNRLIQQLKQQGTLVYLLSLPGLITNDPTNEELKIMHFPRNTGKKLQIYKAIYKKYASTLEKVSMDTNTPIIDLCELIKTAEQRRIFTDTMHINADGARLFGHYIAENLRSKVKEMLNMENN